MPLGHSTRLVFAAELTTIANVMPAPPMPFVATEHHGKLVIFAMMCYAGAVEMGERVMAPFEALATPIVDMVKPSPYPEIYLPDDPDRVLGGAMARVPIHATAFAHRKSRIMVNVAALYERLDQAAVYEPWDRLRAIKRRYDPTNLFKICQNIPPAAQG